MGTEPHFEPGHHQGPAPEIAKPPLLIEKTLLVGSLTRTG
jgi:hypothetical protein